MNKTKIEWVKNPDGTQGFTSNPFTGCLNGCPYCYARQESYGRCKQADLAGYPLEKGHDDDPFYPRYHPERLLDIVARKKPAGIFLNDRSDGFADYWPQNYQEDIWETIGLCPQHRFHLLTKQPQNLIKWSPFPDNVWLGVSATDWLKFSDALGHLATIQAKVKYISFEPLLERIDFDMMQKLLFPKVVNWVIIGAQTKPYKPPEISWVKEIVEACDKAGIPVFLKDNLKPLFNSISGTELMMNDCLFERFRVNLETKEGELILRQEMPNV